MCVDGHVLAEVFAYVTPVLVKTYILRADTARQGGDPRLRAQPAHPERFRPRRCGAQDLQAQAFGLASVHLFVCVGWAAFLTGPICRRRGGFAGWGGAGC
eukprot:COSAG01_NODE_952_length_12499_cov_84.157661_15_plen_100_part_00